MVQREHDAGNLRPNRERYGGPRRPRCVVAAEEKILNTVEENSRISKGKSL